MLDEEWKAMNANMQFLFQAKNQIERSHREEIEMRRMLESKLVAKKNGPDEKLEYEEHLNKELKADLTESQ